MADAGNAPSRPPAAAAVLYAWQLLRGTTEADYKMILCERRQWLRTVGLVPHCPCTYNMSRRAAPRAPPQHTIQISGRELCATQKPRACPGRRL